MTAIVVHRDGWAVADHRAIVGNNWILPTVNPKVRVYPNVIVGMAGASGWCWTELDKQNPKEVSAMSIAQAMNQAHDGDYGALLVTIDRGLMFTSGTGELEHLNTKFWAIGSGDEFVLGYLRALERVLGGDITPAHAVMAIQACSEVCSGVSAESFAFRFTI
jgi:ATP-dependent protease HslVU (ClpYQ) peptidase subunit